MGKNSEQGIQDTDNSVTKTALITGASSGLGAEFASQLASIGYNLVITARREDLLRQLADSLKSRFQIEVLVFPADLSELPQIEKLVDLVKEVQDLDLLVNSAGFGTVGRFYQIDPTKEQAMLNVHVYAPVMLSRAVIPCMLSRRHGGIINVASIAGLIAIRNVLYHSTKSFQIHFSEVLRSELRGTGILVQALCPGFTITGFHDTSEYSQFTRNSIPRFLWMTSEQVVTESLRCLPKGRLYCFPGSLYKIAGILATNSLTAGMIKQIGNWIVYRHKAL